MSETLRLSTYQVPMPTRSSDATAECFGERVLSWFHEDTRAEASYLVLGQGLHHGIEWAINLGWDLEHTQKETRAWLLDALDDVATSGRRRIEATDRTFDGLLDDAERMMTQWFTQVHPDSIKRHPFYDRFEWPPKPEVRFERKVQGLRYPVWGTVDTVFKDKDGPGGAIVDWKSAKNKLTSYTQLHFYRYGLEVPEYDAAFHMLDRVQARAVLNPAPAYPGDEVMFDLARRTEKKKQELVMGYWPDFKPSVLCGWCPVQHHCPEGGDPRTAPENRVALRRALQQTEMLKEVL